MIRHRGKIAPVLSLVGACLWIVVAACSDQSTAPAAPVKDTVITSLELNLPERTIGILGTRVWVRASALTEQGEMLYSSFQQPARFSWSSSASDIAPVDETACLPFASRCDLVTGLSEGTATITATGLNLTASLTVTVRDRARLAWSVPVGRGSILAGIAVGTDGTIHIGTNDYPTHRSVWHALSPDGSELWARDLPLTGSSTPAIGEDGTLYLGSFSNGFVGQLIAVGPGGTIRWVLEDIDPIRSSAAVGPDGTIYVAGGYHVYAVDPGGEIKWAYERDDNVFVASSPAVASDGTIYVGGYDQRLHAINSDGSARWTSPTGGIIQSSPSIGADGTIYVGSMDGRLYAVNPDGTKRWSLELDWPGRGVRSSPSIGPDGTIYVVGLDVVAVDPAGVIRWTYPSSGGSATPILGADGSIYLTGGAQGPGRDAVYALDAQGDLLWDYRTGGYVMGSLAIGVDGTIVSSSFSEPSPGSYEATVHAIVETEPANGGYAGAPWPQGRGGRGNSGRVGG